ncbi:hypothetical protein HPP92_017579 [Vanilla planifolia]|uniref:protein acetyllysine N-acetyltransferase n=1 Tax=Vanilla planifolia TaxID=51239 RepID=A0A835UQP9_VANPL|nr:hypothetical protein HPP92_017579 [Vanilla planifolia]
MGPGTFEIFEVETIGMKLTSRQCSNVDCQAKLGTQFLIGRTIKQYRLFSDPIFLIISPSPSTFDALPKKEMSLAERHCRMADVVLCLGTSLQITPACNLPLKSLSGGGRIVIVNLQPTPKDKKASLVVNGLVDKVIEGVMHLLNLRIPPYVRIDFVQIVLIHAKRRKTYAKWTLRLLSVHGSRAPLPFVKSVEVTFPERTDMKAAFLSKQPFVLKRETARKKPFMMALKINFNHGCGCASTTILWDVDFQVKQNSFIRDKNEILQKLRTKAEQESQCGQLETIERQVLPRFNSTTHAIATNIVRYHLPDAKSAEGDDAICTSNGPTTKRLDDGDNSDELPPKRAKLVRSDV